MKEYIYQISITVFVFLLGVCAGCSDDSDTPETETGKEKMTIQSLIDEGSLLVKVEQSADEFHFYFETDTLSIPST